MAKVRNIDLPKSQVKSEGQLVGLSNCPNLTAKINFKQYLNGEGVIRIVNDRSQNLTAPPPRRKGKLIQKGISVKASRKIKRMARQFQFLVEHDKRFAGYCAFITLSYPYYFPEDHDIAKRHLDNFLKRLRRRIEGFMYLWVAELQKRGAIHFHILTPHFVNKDLINKAWKDIVSKWYKSEGKEFNKVLPNVKKVYSVGSYMAKYMTKEGKKIQGNMYGASENAHQLLKPVHEENIIAGEHEAIGIVQSALEDGIDIERFKVKDKANKVVAIWFPDCKHVLQLLRENKIYYGEAHEE